jgi:tungstate transport system permease protein
MHELSVSLGLAGQMIGAGDARLAAIVLLSLKVSLGATLLSSLAGMPLGALLSVGRFPGRRALIVLFNGLMGLPPVVVGLLVYLLLSRAGPLGQFGLLFTPTAMVVAQTVLVTPIIAALTRQVIDHEWREYREQLRSLGASRPRAARTLLWNARFSLSTAALAGFGRAIAEVGAVMIVGGNIEGVTRVMTTTIALETSKGDLPLALALGAILIGAVLAINTLAYVLRQWAERRWG